MISILILLCLFLADIILHRDMSRAIIPSSFSDKIKAVNLPLCVQQFSTADKHWIKSVNTIALINKIPAETAGFEAEVNFNNGTGRFELINDSITPIVELDALLKVYQSRKLSANLLLNLKNLSSGNIDSSLAVAIRLRNEYSLKGKLLVESSEAKYLKDFCDNGFFTSFSVPIIDPYKITEDEMIHFSEVVKKDLTNYPASSVSCFYFQYPALKKFFPNYPILTWIDHASLSVVSYVFKKQLENDERIKVISSPYRN